MAVLSVRWADDHLKQFGTRIDRLNRQFPNVLPREINKVGARAKTQVIRNLTQQTGLPRKTIVKAVGKQPAVPGRLSYEMVTRGGKIRLKYLAPRETRAGVTAVPWGKRTLFRATFMKGGAFPKRHGGKFNGHVMRRLNTSGTKLTQARSEMNIPTEMTTGATASAFVSTAAPLLKQRIEAILAKMLG